jgi:hypothetical protein
MPWKKVEDNTDHCGVRLAHYEWYSETARRTFIAIEYPQVSDSKYFIDQEEVSRERWEKIFNDLAKRDGLQKETILPNDKRKVDPNFALFFKHFAEVAAKEEFEPFTDEVPVSVRLIIGAAIGAEREGFDLGQALVNYVNKGTTK